MDEDNLSFGPFRIDMRNRALFRTGDPVALGSRALDILRVLAAARGEIVSKEALLGSVWLDQTVEENALHVHVSALRKALNGKSAEDQYIMTVTGRGYRLVDCGHSPCPPTQPPPRLATIAQLRCCLSKHQQ